MNTPKSRIIRVLFLVGISFKGIDGALEVIGGTVLFFVSNAEVHRLLVLLVTEELEDDHDNLIANHFMRVGNHLSVSTKTFVSIYLIGHGLVKLVLVANLLRNKKWAYRAAITLMLGFIGYQIFRIVQQFSLMLTALTILDIIIVVLIWLEYRVQHPKDSQTPVA